MASATLSVSRWLRAAEFGRYAAYGEMLMKRLLISMFGAILVVSFLVVGFILGAYIYRELHGPEWISAMFFLLLSWPLFIFNPIFGTYQSGLSDHESTLSALVATLFTHLLIYSLLIYFSLWWRERKNRLP